MQHVLNLIKPENYSNRIEPLKSVKALTRLMIEKQKREDEDRLVVEKEFDRIKQGLAMELQKYRSEEYDRMKSQLEENIKLINERDKEIERLKTEGFSDDAEIWKRCPNCQQMRILLESHPNDDKQKIFRLEREVESLRHIVEHLQVAIQNRSGNFRGESESFGGSYSTLVASLREELADATRKNKELQKLLLDSPFLTIDVKQRAARLLTGSYAGDILLSKSTDPIDTIEEKDRQIQHLRDTLREMTFKHVQELENFRTQIQRYDEQVMMYVKKLQQRDAAADSPLSLKLAPSNHSEPLTPARARSGHIDTPLRFSSPTQRVSFAPSMTVTPVRTVLSPPTLH
jgi:hypothetical protein